MYHNTILTHGNTNLSIEYRFDTTGGDVRNNLTDARIGSREGGEFTAGGNVLDATADIFVDPENGDLHLKSNATNAIDAVDALFDVPIDIDGQPRPDEPKVDAGADERADVNHVPTIEGDLDFDGIVNDVDIDLLSGRIRANDFDDIADLNDDKNLDRSDMDVLIQQILGTNYGDSNLDGMFTSADMIQVFQAGEYEDEVTGNSKWSTGDWNGDGECDTADLVFVFQLGWYEL